MVILNWSEIGQVDMAMEIHVVLQCTHDVASNNKMQSEQNEERANDVHMRRYAYLEDITQEIQNKLMMEIASTKCCRMLQGM